MSFEKTRNELNQLVADLSQMSAAIHQVHWYMRGRGFMHLHPLMDDLRDEVEEQLDEVAERLIAIDGSPYSTLEEFAEHSKLPSASGEWGKTIPEHFERLVEGYRTLEAGFRSAVHAAQEEGDFGSEDMLTGLVGAAEKQIWMLQAELDKAPKVD